MKINKVCSIVLNSISRDARVLKQARSLSGAGHDLTVLGIKDDKFNLSTEMYSDSVKLIRVDLNRIRYIAVGLISIILFILVNLLILTKPYLPHILSLLILFFGFNLLAIGNSSEVSKDPNNFLYKKFGKLLAVIKTELRFFSKFVLYAIFVKKILEIRPDVIHCHDVHTLPIGVMAKFFLRCKLVYDAHEIYEEVPQVLLKQHILKSYRRIHNFAQKFIDEFITINPSIADWYSKKYPKLPPATIIMNATTISQPFEYDGRLHHAAGLDRHVNVLLYQGGFSHHRGLDYLVKSAAHFPSDWVLVMMGWGSYEVELKVLANDVNQLALAKGRSEVIKFIPPAPQSELVQWTAGGTIGIIPYENTGLNHWFCTPNKLWEFPNAGLPLIVSPFPELRRPIDEFKNGWVMPTDEDVSFIGNLIAGLTPADIKQASLNSRAFIESNNWSTYEQRLVELYAQLD